MNHRLNRGLSRLRIEFEEKVTRRRFTMPPELIHADRISSALECIQRRWPESFDSANDPESPIFIFSAGWRSGSTLLQRLIVSTGETIIWGEPLGDAAMIQRLAQSISAITDTWPPDSFFDRESGASGLSDKWIANLSPDIGFLRSSHRALFQEWLGKSAKGIFGAERWGLKEVRLTIHHAKYLKWLYPKARFLFIYRHLFDAYRSWKGNRWKSVWPGYYPKSPVVFARHWRNLLEGFLEGYRDVDGVLIRFEDLVSGKVDLSGIASYLQVDELNSSVLKKTVRTTGGDQSVRKNPLTIYDRIMLTWTGGSLLAKLGYNR